MKKRYIIRAAKYLVQLIVLISLMLTLMNLGDLSRMEVYFSQRGLYLNLIIVAFALLYPLMGYVKRTLTFNVQTNAEEFKRIMTMNNYKLISEDGDTMTFRASTMIKKLFLMWEDEIVVKSEDGLSTITGPRREVVKTQMRCQTYIQ